MDQAAQIRDKIDIVAFISDYIPLKKAGKNYNTLCPFHGEKTPSFVVSSERSIWHCFGCGKGGDIFTFLMEFERLEFPEALKILAKQAGIELTSSGFADSAISAKKDRLIKANSIAADFYHFILTKHEAGNNAMTYLANRGINEKLIETFKIGFAPGSGKSLIRYLLQKKRLDKIDIIEAGLATQYSNGISDFFRGRIMFPLIDYRGNTLGFSGRILDEKSAFGGKYINTKETLIYHKRTQFYGLNITLDAIKKANQVIIVEGELDVIACYREGVSNVAGIKGTALTEEQINLLSRFIDKISLCFDRDQAGIDAVIRSLPVLAKKNLNTTIIITQGKDPDESIRSNAIEFKKSVQEDINIYDYLFTKTLNDYSSDQPEGKRKIAETLLPIIDQIENAIIKEHYLRKLSVSLNTTYESIVTELEKKKNKKLEKSLSVNVNNRTSRIDMLEEYLVSLVFQADDPVKIAAHVWSIISEYIPKTKAPQKLLTYFSDFTTQVKSPDLAKFSSSLPVELIEIFNRSLLFPLPNLTDDDKKLKEAEKAAIQIKQIYLKDRIKNLSDSIKEKRSPDKAIEAEKLKEEYSKLVGKLKQ